MLQQAADAYEALGDGAAAARLLAERTSYAAPYTAYYARNASAGLWGDLIEQTPALMPLAVGYTPSPASTLATFAWLVNNIETAQGGHLSTGAVGTRFLHSVLAAGGRADLAAFLAAQSTFPSPGWWVTQGATTGWEDYSGVADVTHPPGPSHNHPFLVSHGLWVWEGLLGLAPAAPGFARALAAPPALADLAAMSGELDAPPGTFSLSWAWAGAPAASGALVNFTLPPNTGGELRLPVPGLGASAVVAESGAPVWRAGAFVPGTPGVLAAVLAPDASYIAFTLESGAYAFAASAPAGRTAAPSRRCVPRQDTLELACPPGDAIHRVERAGFVYGDAEAFVASGAGTPGGAASKRFLVTHAIETLCKGAGDCSITMEDLARVVAPVDPRPSEDATDLCAAWQCASAWL